MPLLCAVALISAGCTTTRTLDPQSQSSTMGEMKSGDTVKLTLTDGTELDLTFVDQTSEHIIGRDRNGVEHTIVRQDISVLQVRSASTGKSLLLVGGVALLVGAVLAVEDTVDAFECVLGGAC
jgi:hypothetical protein